MLQKIKNHVLLALVFFILTLVQQYGFYYAKGLPIIWLDFGKYLTIFIFFIAFTFVRGFKARFIVLSFLMILNLFQMGHLSYFGTQILPNEIFLFFVEFSEINGVVQNELIHLIIPLIFTIVPLAVGFFFHRKFKNVIELKTITALLILYFLYNPIRTYVTGNTWGRQPSTRELSGMNVYLSLSYFLGRILPHKLENRRYSLAQNDSLKLKLKKGKKEWDNIIVVLGESLTPHHMSLFGYKRPTTPFLEGLKEKENFFSVTGLSSGVSTDVSVAFFMNLGYGDAGATKVAKGEHCLFKSAKEMGYSTHFLSTQSGQQLRYIQPYLCTASLSDYRSLESVSPGTVDPNAAVDRDVIPKLEELLKAGDNRFIILHQRGSHGPWKLRSTEASRKFTETGIDQRINDYDNSVVAFDQFWEELSKTIEKQKSKTLVIYLSDHGEYVGEDGRWGHGVIKPKAFEIPILVHAFNASLPKRTKDLFKNIPQYNIGLFVTQSIGWETNQSPFGVMKDFMIYGNDIDGFAGKAAVMYKPLYEYEIKLLP